MFRLGIIGSDNSHADAFAELVNKPDACMGNLLFPDFRIVGIYGPDPVRTAEVAKNGDIPYIAPTPEDLIGRIDAAMVVFRHGGLHLPHALPFIEAGIPVWVDKPLTVSAKDARTLIDACAAKGLPLTGGSSLKFIPDVLQAKRAADGDTRIGKLRTATIDFPGTLENEYGGLYFYGPHLVEMALKIFGYHPKSVLASATGGCVAAIVRYEDFQVTLDFIPGAQEYHVVLHGEKGTWIREIDLTDLYRYEFEHFAKAMRTGRTDMTAQELYAPIEMLDAILASLASGQAVPLLGY